MMIRNILLFTVILLTTVVYRLEAQQYDHKIIAILPFRASSYKFEPRDDTAMRRLIAFEEALGVQTQEAFFNAMTKDKERLLVDIQDWQLTDSLLRKAHVDFRKVNYMDKQRLAALLKVDAVLTGRLEEIRMGGEKGYVHPDLAIAAIATAERYLFNRKKRMTVLLYDGNTGKALWDFEREIAGTVFSDEARRLDDKLYKSFRKKFPYID